MYVYKHVYIYSSKITYTCLSATYFVRSQNNRRKFIHALILSHKHNRTESQSQCPLTYVHMLTYIQYIILYDHTNIFCLPVSAFAGLFNLHLR